MTDRKNIESTNIEGLIPRQLIQDSQTLLDFLKEYYRFLNQEGGPTYALNTLLDNRDVDRAVDDFLALIHNEIGAGFAKEIRTLQADKNNLYKHIKEFYSCKGSLDSFQTLFKLLFGVNVEIILPKDQMLIASDGRWSQQESFFIETTTGEPLSIVGKIITVTSLNNYIDVEVERIRKVYPAQDYYEIFITRNPDTNRIIVGATIDQYGVQGTVIESLGNIEIVYAGQDFDVPQFVNINEGSTGTLIRISEVTSAGAISKIKIISFGIGYTDFYARIIPKDEIIGAIDLVAINEADIETEIAAHPTHAILKFYNGAIAKYQGEYVSNKGFLSDDIYLQDNYYYQNYSYVIRSGIQIDNYRNIVRKTVHPAGMIFFGEFEITNSFDLSENIQSLARYLRARLSSVADTEDTLEAVFYKVLPEVDIYAGFGSSQDTLTPNDNVADDYTDGVDIWEIERSVEFRKDLPQIGTQQEAEEDSVTPGDAVNNAYTTDDTPPISRDPDERIVDFYKNPEPEIITANGSGPLPKAFSKNLLLYNGIDYGDSVNVENQDLSSTYFQKDLPQIGTQEEAEEDNVIPSDNVAADYIDGLDTYEIERYVDFRKIVDPSDPTEDYATPGDTVNAAGDQRIVNFYKNPPNEDITVNGSDPLPKDFSKNLLLYNGIDYGDSINVENQDLNSTHFSKNLLLYSGIDYGDSVNVEDEDNTSITFNKADGLDHTVTVEQQISFIMSFVLTLSHSVTAQSDMGVYFSDKPFDNQVGPISNIANINFTKSWNNDINIVEAGRIEKNPYTYDSEFYFAEIDYTEGNYNIT